MNTVDFTGYAVALSAFDRADALKTEGSVARATWLDENAKTVADALPPLGTMGAPKKGSTHKAMADAIRAMFPALTDDAKKHVVTRLFLLCRVAAVRVRDLEHGETIEEYAVRVDKWAKIVNKEDTDTVRALIDGTYGKRGPKGGPVDNGGDGGDDDGDTSTDGTLAGDGGKPKTDPANLIPVIFDSCRTVIASYEKGTITPEAFAKFASDFAYMNSLVKAARGPVAVDAA